MCTGYGTIRCGVSLQGQRRLAPRVLPTRFNHEQPQHSEHIMPTSGHEKVAGQTHVCREVREMAVVLDFHLGRFFLQDQADAREPGLARLALQDTALLLRLARGEGAEEGRLPFAPSTPASRLVNVPSKIECVSAG